MDYAQFESRFKPSRVAPVYVILAQEPFFANSTLRLIREAKLKGADPATCLSEYSGKEASVGAVLEDCRTRPLFGPARLVIVEQADTFIRENLERLNAYRAKPASFTCLVLVAEKIDRRWAFARALEKQSGLVECKRLYPDRIVSWLVRRARLGEKRLDGAAAAALVDHVGTDLEQLDHQLQSLILFAGESNRITTEHVDALVGTDHTRAIWELSDAVAKREVKKALTVLDRLRREGVESVQVIALLARHTEQMLRMKPLLAQGMTPDQVAGELRLHPFRAKMMAGDVRKVKSDTLKRKCRLLLEADLQSKSSAGNTDLLLECLLINLCTVH